jgi:hypothetical protein
MPLVDKGKLSDEWNIMGENGCYFVKDGKHGRKRWYCHSEGRKEERLSEIVLTGNCKENEHVED